MACLSSEFIRHPAMRYSRPSSASCSDLRWSCNWSLSSLGKGKCYLERLVENLIKTYLLVKYCRLAQKTADIAPGHFPQESEEIEKWINPEIGVSQNCSKLTFLSSITCQSQQRTETCKQKSAMFLTFLKMKEKVLRRNRIVPIDHWNPSRLLRFNPG